VDNKQASQVTTGVIVILIGLVFLSGQWRMGLDVGKLWPLVLVVLGISRYLSTNERGERGNGGWLLFLGAIFLLNNFRIFGLGDSWPLFIVAAGVSMILSKKNSKAASKQVPS
jgi:hypothetical protein